VPNRNACSMDDCECVKYRGPNPWDVPDQPLVLCKCAHAEIYHVPGVNLDAKKKLRFSRPAKKKAVGSPRAKAPAPAAVVAPEPVAVTTIIDASIPGSEVMQIHHDEKKQAGLAPLQIGGGAQAAHSGGHISIPNTPLPAVVDDGSRSPSPFPGGLAQISESAAEPPSGGRTVQAPSAANARAAPHHAHLSPPGAVSERVDKVGAVAGSAGRSDSRAEKEWTKEERARASPAQSDTE